MTVAVDSNVWISALVFGGQPRKIFEVIVGNGHLLAISDELVSEVRRILVTKFPEFTEDFENLLKLLGNFTGYHQIGHKQYTICRDPNDNYLLELADVSGSQYLITGDNDLLLVKERLKFKITSPREFILGLDF